MSYSVKEIFYSLQGEGARAGRPAVLCRFAGCNLWSGRERDRATAQCRFCDTDFRGTAGPNGGRFATAAALAERIYALWPDRSVPPYVIITGGEPALQLDESLINALHERGCEVAVETNGTLPVPDGIDWLCVSPKAGAPLQITAGDELKLVYPQADALPEHFVAFAFRHFFLQPCDDDHRAANLTQAIAYCLAHPRWRLSVQWHKWLDLP